MSRRSTLRPKLVAIVAANPGLCVRELLAALGGQSGAAHRALMTSEAKGLVTVDRRERKHAVYPC